MAQPEIDGALVGGASLDPDDFARIVQYRDVRTLTGRQEGVQLSLRRDAAVDLNMDGLLIVRRPA